MSELVWIKHRTKWAWGATRWEYMEVRKDELDRDPDDFAQNFLQDPMSEMSDKFRGYEWDEVECLPKETLELKIKGTEHEIEGLTKDLERYKAQYNQRYG